MNRNSEKVGRVVIKMVVAMVLAAGALVTGLGCDDDEYLGTGSGFRYGNYNQGLSGHVDCFLNPFDPRC